MGIKTILWFSCLISLALARSSTRPLRQAQWASLMQRLRRETVDLHSGEFCVDVSTFGPVLYDATPREKCTTVFNKQCEDKTEQVCDEVTEIQCEIQPYTECQMTMEVETYRGNEIVQKTFEKKLCQEAMDVVQHTKMMPECKNVTKQNCITKWETDEDGNQVWAGNEACEPVTWRECKLVPRQVDFKVPKIECNGAEEIPYNDMEEVELEQMVTKMVCEVKHVTACNPVVSTKCANINYQECAELPEETCEEIEMQLPRQEKEHKKKCLLPDDGPGAPGLAARAPDTLNTLADSAAEAQEVPAESQTSYAQPLPVDQQQQQGQLGQYQPRQGRRQQKKQQQQRQQQQRRAKQQQQQQQQRFFQQQQNGQFVRHQ